MLQLYCGYTSHLIAVYPMKTDHEMANTLELHLFIVHMGHPMSCSVTMLEHKLVKQYAKSFGCTQLKTSNANHITNIKTSPNSRFKKLGNVATSSWIIQVHQQQCSLNSSNPLCPQLTLLVSTLTQLH
jgi:hypothetical protein